MNSITDKYPIFLCRESLNPDLNLDDLRDGEALARVVPLSTNLPRMDYTLDHITALFAQMQASGFDTTAPLKWCYYFSDAQKAPLRPLFEQLRDEGYVNEYIGQVEADQPWTLFMSKSEVLSPSLLHERNLAFNQLAVQHGIAAYDGWRVEKMTLFNAE